MALLVALDDNRRRPSLASRAAAIVAAGNGALYDPSDLTSLYQGLTGGATGASGSVVGIMLDKAQMGGRTAAAYIAGQPELALNGNFNSDTEWTKGIGWSIGSGVASALLASADLSQAILTVGSWYQITYTVSGYVTGTLTPKAGSGASGTTVSANGTYTAVLRAATTTSLIFTGAAFTGNIDNVSVRAIPGYHAVAPSDAARPLLTVAGGLARVTFDGVDDALLLAADWASTNGVSAAAAGTIAAISETTNIYDGSNFVGAYNSSFIDDFALGIRRSATLLGASAYAENGTAGLEALTGGYTVGSPCVVYGDANATAVRAALNGGSLTTSGPARNDLIVRFLGWNNNVTAPGATRLNGDICGACFLNGVVSASDRRTLEQYFASLSGVTLYTPNLFDRFAAAIFDRFGSQLSLRT